MSTNSFYSEPSEWKIQPAEEHHVTEIANWIKAIDTDRLSNANLIAGALRNEIQLARNSYDISYYVGTKDGQLMFYFNGTLKARRGILSGKVHKKKDFTLSVVVNVLLEGYRSWYNEIWFKMLVFVFKIPDVGRVITEVDVTDEILVSTLQRLGFHQMRVDEAPNSTLPCFVCKRTDFAPLAAL